VASGLAALRVRDDGLHSLGSDRRDDGVGVVAFVGMKLSPRAASMSAGASTMSWMFPGVK